MFLDTDAQGELGRVMLLSAAPPWPGFQNHCLEQNTQAFHQLPSCEKAAPTHHSWLPVSASPGVINGMQSHTPL